MDTRKKFVWISGIVLSAIIIILLVGINLWNDAASREKADDILHFVANYGEKPELSVHANGSAYAAALAESTGLTPRQALDTSIYFTALADADHISSVRLNSSTGMDIDVAQEAAEAAFAQNSDSGRAGSFQYIRSRDADGIMHYSFLDISADIIEGLQLAAASFGGGCLAIAAVMIYIWLGAVKWIRPEETDAEPAKPGVNSIQDKPNTASEITNTAAEPQKPDAESTPSDVPMVTASLSKAVERACREIRGPVEQRGGELITDIQPDVFIRTHDGEDQTLCRLLIWEALRTMRPGGSVHVDLLSDGTDAGLIVRSAGTPWQHDNAPKGDDLATVRLIARDNDGQASFEAIDPDTTCYTVRFKSAKNNI